MTKNHIETSRGHLHAGQVAILAWALMGVAFAQAPFESAVWQDASAGFIPDNSGGVRREPDGRYVVEDHRSLAAGVDDGGAGTLYSCRAKPPGSTEFQLGKIRRGFKGCLIALPSGAIEATTYQVLMNFWFLSEKCNCV